MYRRGCLYSVSIIVGQIIRFTGTYFYSPVIFRISGILHNANHRILSGVTLLPLIPVGTVDTIFAIGTIHAILTVRTIRTICTIFTIGTVLTIFSVRTVGTVHTVFTIRTIYAILTVCTVYAVFPGISIRTGISFLPVTDSNRSTFGEGDSIPRTIRQFLDMSNVISYPVGIDNHLKIINILIQFFT